MSNNKDKKKVLQENLKKTVKNKKMFKSDNKFQTLTHNLPTQSKNKPTTDFKDSSPNQSNALRDSLEQSFSHENTKIFSLTRNKRSEQDSLEKWKTPVKDEFSFDRNEDFVVKNFEEFSTDKNSLEKNCFGQRNLHSLNTTNVKHCLAPLSYKSSIVVQTQKEIQTIKKEKLADCISPIRADNRVFKEKFYWFAAYDNFMKKEKLTKIFGKKFEKFEEKLISVADTMKNFEICFFNVLGSFRPYLRYSEDGTVFLRMYLLTLNQLILLYNYINKNEGYQKLEEDDLEIHSSQGNAFTRNADKPFGEVLCLGNLHSKPIFTFTKNSKDLTQPLTTDSVRTHFKYIVKFARTLINTFPSYSSEFFLYHLYSRKGISNRLSITDFSHIQKQIKADGKMFTPFENFKRTSKEFEKQNLKLNKHNDSSRNEKLVSTETLLPRNDYSMNTVSKANEISLKKISSFNEETKTNSKNSTIFINNNTNMKVNGNRSTKNVYVVARDKKFAFEDKVEESQSSDSEAYIPQVGHPPTDYFTPKKAK